MGNMNEQEVRQRIKEQFTKINKEHPEVLEIWLCYVHGYMESRMDQGDLEAFEEEYKKLLSMRSSKNLHVDM